MCEIKREAEGKKVEHLNKSDREKTLSKTSRVFKKAPIKFSFQSKESRRLSIITNKRSAAVMTLHSNLVSILRRCNRTTNGYVCTLRLFSPPHQIALL